MEKNNLYWEYNLPLQYWPGENGEDATIVNYSPRRAQAQTAELDLGEQTHEEFFNTAADKLENLAKLMRRAAKEPTFHVYYHDADPNEK